MTHFLLPLKRWNSPFSTRKRHFQYLLFSCLCSNADLPRSIASRRGVNAKEKRTYSYTLFWDKALALTLFVSVMFTISAVVTSLSTLRFWRWQDENIINGCQSQENRWHLKLFRFVNGRNRTKSSLKNSCGFPRGKDDQIRLSMCVKVSKMSR